MLKRNIGRDIRFAGFLGLADAYARYWGSVDSKRVLDFTTNGVCGEWGRGGQNCSIGQGGVPTCGKVMMILSCGVYVTLDALRC